MLRPGGHLVVSDTQGRSRVGALPAPGDGGRTVGYIPAWRHGAGEYLRTALSHGFEVRACEEPVREPMDVETGARRSCRAGRAVDFWGLMPFVPEATRAAYLGTTALLVWDFQRR